MERAPFGTVRSKYCDDYTTAALPVSTLLRPFSGFYIAVRPGMGRGDDLLIKAHQLQEMDGVPDFRPPVIFAKKTLQKRLTSKLGMYILTVCQVNLARKENE